MIIDTDPIISKIVFIISLLFVCVPINCGITPYSLAVWPVFFNQILANKIEEPRVKTRGFSDPSGICIFLLVNPAASRGECARGIQ